MKGKLLIAAVVACVVIAPALAFSQTQTSGSFKAVDDAWQANGVSGATTLTVAKPATVTFSYPSGSHTHNVHWTSSQKPKSCSGVPNANSTDPEAAPPWQGTCTFEDTGTYAFTCLYHFGMKGTVVVETPAPSPSPTPTPTATATPDGSTTNPSPSATATPQSTPTATTQSPRPLTAKLASAQKGTRVRGSVEVAQAASRLEITLKFNKTRVGRWVKAAAASGTTRFTVALDARGRKELKRRRSLKLSVTIAISPRGGAKQVRVMNVRLRG